MKIHAAEQQVCVCMCVHENTRSRAAGVCVCLCVCVHGNTPSGAAGVCVSEFVHVFVGVCA